MECFGVGRSSLREAVLDAIQARDYTIVQSFTLIIAVGYVLINLIVDLLYAFLDPRIRLS